MNITSLLNLFWPIFWGVVPQKCTFWTSKKVVMFSLLNALPQNMPMDATHPWWSEHHLSEKTAAAGHFLPGAWKMREGRTSNAFNTRDTCENCLIPGKPPNYTLVASTCTFVEDIFYCLHFEIVSGIKQLQYHMDIHPPHHFLINKNV